MEGSKDKQAIANFIDFMPDSKLEGLPSTGGTIHKNFDFHFDMQGVSALLPLHPFFFPFLSLPFSHPLPYLTFPPDDEWHSRLPQTPSTSLQRGHTFHAKETQEADRRGVHRAKDAE